jgi:hypothetical protein
MRQPRGSLNSLTFGPGRDQHVVRSWGAITHHDVMQVMLGSKRMFVYCSLVVKRRTRSGVSISG